MKKLLIFLMACTLFIACNNDKSGKKADNRDKDDYTTTDDKTTDDKNKDDDDKQGDDKSKKNDDDDDQNDMPTNDGWSEKDKNKFLTDCMGESSNNQAQGKKICSCVLDKLEKKYTSLTEADAKGGEAEGRKMATECLDELNITIPSNNNNNKNNNDQDDYSNGGWTSSEVKEFVVPCVREARKGGMEELDAQSYCDCMQDKLSKIYPVYNDAKKLTQADLQSPAMKRMVRSCLPGN